MVSSGRDSVLKDNGIEKSKFDHVPSQSPYREEHIIIS